MQNDLPSQYQRLYRQLRGLLITIVSEFITKLYNGRVGRLDFCLEAVNWGWVIGYKKDWWECTERDEARKTEIVRRRC